MKQTTIRNPAVNSPFIIIENAISPLQCEEVVDSMEFLSLDVDKTGNSRLTTKMSDFGSAMIDPIVRGLDNQITAKYGSSIFGLDKTRVCWADHSVQPGPICDNSIHVKNKWLRVHDRDLTVVVFLSDYNEQPPFDGEFEVYGGKMEFPSHGFGFNPIRGTMIIMPADPHFTHIFSPISAGDLYISKTFVTLKEVMIYSPKQFPGVWSQWLADSF